uniref:WAP domain-containing protein n=1 Tax=Salarias fasciatus TaxID=181472 RepID=A0A672FAB6_SALFA
RSLDLSAFVPTCLERFRAGGTNTVLVNSSAAVKPGKCPRPSGPGICIQACNHDYDCETDQKCCSNGCGNVCMGPLRGCPREEHGRVGICALIPRKSCLTDDDCSRGLKCCSSGCGRKCVAVVKPGVCPRPSGFSTCIQACNHDYDCETNQKCCSNGCGKVCMGPLRGKILTKSTRNSTSTDVIDFFCSVP